MNKIVDINDQFDFKFDVEADEVAVWVEPGAVNAKLVFGGIAIAPPAEDEEDEKEDVEDVEEDFEVEAELDAGCSIFCWGLTIGDGRTTPLIRIFPS